MEGRRREARWAVKDEGMLGCPGPGRRVPLPGLATRFNFLPPFYAHRGASRDDLNGINP